MASFRLWTERNLPGGWAGGREETVLVAGGRRRSRLRRIVDHLRCHHRFIGMAWEDGEGVGERQGGKR